MHAAIRLLSAGFGCLALGASAWAHHNFAAQFDADQPVQLSGVVTRVDWMNPHVYFYIDVLNEQTGEMENWGLEMGPPHSLQRRGWKRNSMQVGDAVSVAGTRARDGSLNANARRVTLESTGEELGAASSEDSGN